MKYFINRIDAKALPNGTILKHKATGSTITIKCQCYCGEWLHYEVLNEKGAASIEHHVRLMEAYEIQVGNDEGFDFHVGHDTHWTDSSLNASFESKKSGAK